MAKKPTLEMKHELSLEERRQRLEMLQTFSLEEQVVILQEEVETLVVETNKLKDDSVKFLNAAAKCEAEHEVTKARLEEVFRRIGNLEHGKHG